MRFFRTTLNGSSSSIANNVDAIIGTAFLLIIQAYSQPTFQIEPSWEIDSLLPHSNGIFQIVRKTREHALSCIFQSICVPKLLPLVFPTMGPGLDLIFMVRMNSSDSVADQKILTAVIESLTIVVEAITSRPNLGNTPPSSLLVYLVQWLSFLPPPFVALVNERDPKALIIMAYYYSAVAFLLSKLKHGWWWMRERPVYMVRHISDFLGDQWEVWMRWPVEVLQRCNGDLFSYETLEDAADLDVFGLKGTPESEMGILSNLQLHFGKIQV
jgi:hypothetical protein